MNPVVATLFTLSYTFAMSERAVLASALRGSDRVVRDVALQWSQNLCKRCGVVIETRGADRVDWERPLVIVSNHSSHFDIPVMMSGLGRPLGFLTKSELFKIPAFGTAMRKLGCVAIDREQTASARAALQLGARRVREGAQLVVFAEGTRTDDGALKPFKKGPFYLIQQAGVQAVPVALVGTRKIAPKHTLRVNAADVSLRVGEPILCEDDSSEARERLRVRMHAAVSALMQG
jgi:1-acyl-sn-glycerol-3-phosphate acyltransferase